MSDPVGPRQPKTREVKEAQDRVELTKAVFHILTAVFPERHPAEWGFKCPWCSYEATGYLDLTNHMTGLHLPSVRAAISRCDLESRKGGKSTWMNSYRHYMSESPRDAVAVLLDTAPGLALRKNRTARKTGGSQYAPI